MPEGPTPTISPARAARAHSEGSWLGVLATPPPPLSRARDPGRARNGSQPRWVAYNRSGWSPQARPPNGAMRRSGDATAAPARPHHVVPGQRFSRGRTAARRRRHRGFQPTPGAGKILAGSDSHTRFQQLGKGHQANHRLRSPVLSPGHRRGRRRHHRAGSQGLRGLGPAAQFTKRRRRRREQIPISNGSRGSRPALTRVHRPVHRGRPCRGGPPGGLSLRPQATGAFRQPWRDPGGRSGRLRSRLPSHRQDPERRLRGVSGWRRRSHPGRRLHPGNGGGAGGLVGSGPAQRIGTFRQARSAPGPVLRGNHLRHAVAIAR